MENSGRRFVAPRALLREEEVREIRASEESNRDLALAYDVSEQCIVDCRSRKTWKHIE